MDEELEQINIKNMKMNLRLRDEVWKVFKKYVIVICHVFTHVYLILFEYFALKMNKYKVIVALK